MRDLIRAVAFDYDGTLVQGSAAPSSKLLAAMAELRDQGYKLILVTGRVLAELAHVFPRFADSFDIVVAENGAVLYHEGATHALGSPVPFELDEALVERGVSFSRGQVLLACDARHELTVLEELRRIGADCQLVRNRASLMVMPATVTKGSGLFEALAELGVSFHNTIGVGDAENDHSLLQTCEVGVAVANAVPALRRLADVRLSEANGAGVEQLIRRALLADDLELEAGRWKLDLGRDPSGAPVRLPATPSRLLVTGGSGAGKSYAIGLLAEHLIRLRYSVCVFDPEGDHTPLSRLRGVFLVGGGRPLPDPDLLPDLIRHRMGSVVVDLSLHPTETRADYVNHALSALRRSREEVGLPHWIVIDEAHEPLGRGADGSGRPELGEKGFCLSTYRPEDLDSGLARGVDYLIALTGTNPMEPEAYATLSDETGVSAATIGRDIAKLGFGQALVIRPSSSEPNRVVNLGPRWVRHVRHWHKYAGGRLPLHRRFYFRTGGAPTGASAANLAEFHRALLTCADGVVEHHAANSDFSRWIVEVIQDVDLGTEVESLETRMRHDLSAATIRGELLRLIERRYLE